MVEKLEMIKFEILSTIVSIKKNPPPLWKKKDVFIFIYVTFNYDILWGGSLHVVAHTL